MLLLTIMFLQIEKSAWIRPVRQFAPENRMKV